MNVNGIVGLAEHIVKLHTAEKVGRRKNVFGFDIAAFADADHCGDIRNISVFEALELLFIELKLTENALLARDLSFGEMYGVGTVGLVKEFGVALHVQSVAVHSHHYLCHRLTMISYV